MTLLCGPPACVGNHGDHSELFAHLHYPDTTDKRCFQQNEAITLNCSHSNFTGTVYWLYSGSEDGNTASVLEDSEIPNAVYLRQSWDEHIIGISPIVPSLNGHTVQCLYQKFVSEGQGQPVELRTITSNKVKVLLVPGMYIYVVIGQDTNIDQVINYIISYIYIHAYMHHISLNDWTTYSVLCHFAFRTSGPGVAIQSIARTLHFFFPHQHHLHQPPALRRQVCKRRSQCIKRTECQQQHSSCISQCNSSVKHSNKCLRFRALCGV